MCTAVAAWRVGVYEIRMKVWVSIKPCSVHCITKAKALPRVLRLRSFVSENGKNKEHSSHTNTSAELGQDPNVHVPTPRALQQHDECVDGCGAGVMYICVCPSSRGVLRAFFFDRVNVWVPLNVCFKG